MAGGSYADVLAEEISLEGLDGITPETLWLRLSERFGFEAFGPRMWNIVLQLSNFEFFILPQPRPPVESLHRFIRAEDGTYKANQEFDTAPQTDVYPHFPVKNASGSCEHFKTRVNITDTVDQIPFQEICEKYKDTLVIVGNQEVRWHYLAPGISSHVLSDVTDHAYYVLERIGRSRYNGELTRKDVPFKPYEGDARTRFYVRKSLLSLGLIARQTICVNNFPNIHLSLPRFYCKYKDISIQNIEILKSFFKSSKLKLIPYADLRQYLLTQMGKHRYKIFRKSNTFAKAIKIDRNTYYRAVYPDAPETKWKNRTNSDERKIVTVKYIRNDSDDSNDEDESCNDFGKSNFIGEPLLQQAYKCILNSGTKGKTQKEIAIELGTDNLTARLACRYLILSGVLYTVTSEVNRTKVMRFYSQMYKDKISQDIQNAQIKMEELFDPSDVKNETNINPEKNDSELNDNPNNTHCVDLIKNENSQIIASKLDYSVSLKKLNRINMIMERIREKHVITNLLELKRYICSKETQSQNKETIDRRSILRLVVRLEKEGQLKFYQIKVKAHGSQVVLNLICEPNIDIKNPIIQSTIQETKDKLSSRYKSPLGFVKKPPKPKYVPTAGKAYGLLPKFSRMRLLHEFLFYIVYGHKNKIGHPGDELQQLIEKENLDINNFQVYDDAMDKYMFVPPVGEYLNHPKGWVMLQDVISSMPLVIFMKIVNINYHVKDLSEYLKDPLKSQFLIKNIPDSIKSDLSYKKRFVAQLYDTITRLCCIGLLQLGENTGRNREKMFMYINKNAILTDTTSSKPSYYKVEEKDYPVEAHNFKSFQDVENYWNRMNSICLSTPLNMKDASIGEVVETQPPAIKLAHFLKEKSTEEAVSSDYGYMPGDGLGAAGFDAVFFSHLAKNWAVDIYDIKPVKRKALIRKEVLINYPRKKPLVSRELKPKANTVPIERNKYYIRRILTSRKSSKLTQPKIDEIDQSALRILGLKRTRWNVMENRIVYLAKIAISIMNSNENCVLMKTLRDIVHKCFTSYEKTSNSCLRRVKYLMRNPQMSRNISLQLTEIQRNPGVLKKYQNMHSQFSISSTANPKGLEKFKIHFVELIQFLYSKIYCKDLNKHELRLPNSIDVLYRNFTVETPSNENIEYEPDINSITEIQKGVLSSIIHSALACSHFKDKKYYMLPTYKMYPEQIIRSTLIELRASGMISSQMVPDLKIYKTQKLTTSLFKLSFNYVHNMAKWYRYKMYIQAGAYIKHLTNENVDKEQLDILNGGAAAILLDLLTMNNVSLNLNIPEEIITVNPKYFTDNDQNESINEEITIYNDIFDQTSKSSFSTLQLIEGKMHDTNDIYVIKSCNLKSKLNCSPQELKSMAASLETVFRDILKDAICSKNSQENELDNFNNPNLSFNPKVLDFIISKEDMGATGGELFGLINDLGISKNGLRDILSDLRDKNLIRRVGNRQTKWISINYMKYWFVEVTKKIVDAKNDPNENTAEDDNIQSKKRKLSINATKQHDNTNEIGSNTIRDSVIVKKEDSICSTQLNTHILEEEECPTINIDENEFNVVSPQHYPKDIDNDNENSSDSIIDTEIGDNLETDLLKLDLIEPEESSGFTSKICDSIDSKIIKSLYGNQNIYISPRPWIKPDGTVNFQLLWRWIASILSHLLLNPTIGMIELQQRFKYMQPYHIRLMVEIMSNIGCVRLITINKYKATLWSSFNSQENIIEEATGLEDDADLYIEVLDGAILKYVLFKGSYFHNNV